MDLILYLTFNFFFYGIVGWLLENIFSYITTGHMKKEGFLHIPLKPMYAIAMSILVVCSKVPTIDIYMMLTLCLIVPTFIEFITGLIMRDYFKKDYWDYSELRGNYKGIICIGFSLIWMALSFIGVEIIQVLVVDDLYSFIKPIWSYVYILFILALLLDEVRTIKTFRVKKKNVE